MSTRARPAAPEIGIADRGGVDEQQGVAGDLAVTVADEAVQNRLEGGIDLLRMENGRGFQGAGSQEEGREEQDYDQAG